MCNSGEVGNILFNMILCLSCYFFFFFFSSRRRHTRWTGDWSSDVCSSDLPNVHARFSAVLHTVAMTRATPLASWRSEEHTSELQSPVHLVCRLLLEKKKKNTK